MKTFLIKIVVLIFGCIVILEGGLFFVKQKQLKHLEQTIGAGTIDKHKRLAAITSPKIILVGGSNVMFGFDSELMEKELNLPVQNMALGAALGLRFILNEVKADIKKGDNVLLSLEYFLNDGDYNTKLYIEELNPEAKKYIYYENKLDSFKITTNYSLRKLRNYILLDLFSSKKTIVEDEVYGRNAFTLRGDIKDNLRISQKLPLEGVGIFDKDYSDEIKIISDFVKYAKSKQANVFFSFPPIADTEFKANPNYFASFYEQLASEKAFGIINKPKDAIYPESYFYDTAYHLRSPYHRLHTVKIIDALKKQNAFN